MVGQRPCLVLFVSLVCPVLWFVVGFVLAVYVCLCLPFPIVIYVRVVLFVLLLLKRIDLIVFL